MREEDNRAREIEKLRKKVRNKREKMQSSVNRGKQKKVFLLVVRPLSGKRTFFDNLELKAKKTNDSKKQAPDVFYAHGGGVSGLSGRTIVGPLVKELFLWLL